MKHILLPLLATALAAPADAAPSGPSKGVPGAEVSIPFPGLRIRNFRADDHDVVFIEDSRRNWYRAQLSGPCIGLPFAHAIGIDTRGSSTFDRFSFIVVDGERCPVLSVTRSDKPQKKVKKRGA